MSYAWLATLLNLTGCRRTMAQRPCLSSAARNHIMASSDTVLEMPIGSQISPPVSSPVPSLCTAQAAVSSLSGTRLPPGHVSAAGRQAAAHSESMKAMRGDIARVAALGATMAPL